MAETETTSRRPRFRRHRLVGPHEDYCVRFPADDLAALQRVAEGHGWALAEGVRQAVKLFLAVNMNMSHVASNENGRGDAR